jgi:uncharacterized protein involved in exopolysaccharide biosynthesis
MSKQTPGDEISLRELLIIGQEWFFYLLSQWKTIFLIGIIGGAVGLGLAFLSKPVYTASLSFALEDDKSSGGLSGAISLASQFGFDLGDNGGGMFSGTNLIELFKSRSMVEQALLTPVTYNGKSVSFAEMYIQNQNWRDKWNKEPKLKNVQFLPNADRQHFNRIQDSILGNIYGAISTNGLSVLQKDKKIDIITIEVQSPDENFAKYFTEALAKNVSDFYIETKSKKARINMDILQKQTDSVRAELNSAITGVAIANDNTFALNPALNVRRSPSAKRQVDVQANTAILIELVKQSEMAKVSLRKSTPLIQVIDYPIFPLKKEKLGKLKGLVLGGIIAGILIVLVLIITRLIRRIMAP